jgi:hypothetical protein
MRGAYYSGLAHISHCYHGSLSSIILVNHEPSVKDSQPLTFPKLQILN